LSYEPVPVPFNEARGSALATVSYGLERGSDSQLDRLRTLLKKLNGPSAYADPVVEWNGGTQAPGQSTSRIFSFDRAGTYTVSATRVMRIGGWPSAGGSPLAQQQIRQTGTVDVEVVGPAPNLPMAAVPGTVAKAQPAASLALPDRLPATGFWVLERTEFVVEKVDPVNMQKWKPSESGGDGAGSAQGTFGHPDPRVNTVTVRMKVAWTSPPRVLIPGKDVDFRITVSDAGSDDARGLGVGGIGSLSANCPSRGAVWYGPSARFELKLGERSKEASKTYTPPSAAPGDTMYIVAEYGVFIRRQQFFYLYKFTQDASKVPALVSAPSVPPATRPVTPPPPLADPSNIGTWNVSFNGWGGIMEITERGGTYQGRFNLGGSGWETMLDLRVADGVISFRRTQGDQRYVGTVSGSAIRGTFSQGGAGSYQWTAGKTTGKLPG
jgi:hypothetical protein